MGEATPKLALTGSRNFLGWLSEQKVSLSFSTYQAGKLFFIGCVDDSGLSVFERTFNRCMGIGLEPQTQALWRATLYQVWRFENALKVGQVHRGYDRLYVPQVGYTTGDVDAHDIAVDELGPVFVNTLFSCLARPSERFSFEPICRPPFISRLAAEDRHQGHSAKYKGDVGKASAVVTGKDHPEVDAKGGDLKELVGYAVGAK